MNYFVTFKNNDELNYICNMFPDKIEEFGNINCCKGGAILPLTKQSGKVSFQINLKNDNPVGKATALEILKICEKELKDEFNGNIGIPTPCNSNKEAKLENNTATKLLPMIEDDGDVDTIKEIEINMLDYFNIRIRYILPNNREELVETDLQDLYQSLDNYTDIIRNKSKEKVEFIIDKSRTLNIPYYLLYKLARFCDYFHHSTAVGTENLNINICSAGIVIHTIYNGMLIFVNSINSVSKDLKEMIFCIRRGINGKVFTDDIDLIDRNCTDITDEATGQLIIDYNVERDQDTVDIVLQDPMGNFVLISRINAMEFIMIASNIIKFENECYEWVTKGAIKMSEFDPE